MRFRPADLASIGLLACASILTGVVVKRELGVRRGPPGVVKIKPRAEISLVGRRIGSAGAPSVVVFFGDFQCPYCARAQAPLTRILTEYAEDVQLVYRHLPLETVHPHAWKAALASECAGDQGRFREYHDLLYQVQDSIGRIPWTHLAERAGVASVNEFETCVAEERQNQAIERDIIVARSLGLNGTPAFVVGDELIHGLPPEGWLERRIAREVERRR